MDISNLPSQQVGKYTIFFATTPVQQQQGLQFLSKLPAKHLLAFPRIPSGRYFHTVNCSFPIDLVVLNSQNIVLDIWTVAPNKKLIGPTPSNTVMVVEGNAGWAQKSGLRIGSNLIEALNNA